MINIFTIIGIITSIIASIIASITGIIVICGYVKKSSIKKNIFGTITFDFFK